MTDEPTATSGQSWKFRVLVFLVAAGLTVPWRMFLESLKKDNPDLSTSLLVQLLPVWLALFLLGLKKKKPAP